VDRQRPARVDPAAVLHDDAPDEGPSYPSGHAAIASTAFVVVTPYLPRPLLAVGGALAALTSAVRIRQGAHFPMDAVGGAALGLGVGAGLTAVFGRPARA
jgi:undecaprenyl-diphosphatase